MDILGSRSIAAHSFNIFKSLGVSPPPSAYEGMLDYVEIALNEAWVVYEDYKKSHGVATPNIFSKMFDIAENCNSNKTISHLLKEVEGIKNK